LVWLCKKRGHWRWLSVCLSAPLFQFLCPTLGIVKNHFVYPLLSDPLHLDTQTEDAENNPKPRGNLWETRKMSERDLRAGWAQNSLNCGWEWVWILPNNISLELRLFCQHIFWYRQSKLFEYLSNFLMKVLFAWARNHIVLHMWIEREVNFIVNLDINLRRTLGK